MELPLDSGIRDAGLGQINALAVVKNLTRKHFYKSMTIHADHRVWQDVYHGQWGDVSLYIKFQRAGERTTLIRAKKAVKERLR